VSDALDALEAKTAGPDAIGHLHEKSEAFKGVVFALDWDEDFIRRREGV
jgi:hypothetical protein